MEGLPCQKMVPKWHVLLYIAVSKVEAIPRILYFSGFEYHFCLIRPSFNLLDSLLQEVCILLDQKISLLCLGLKKACLHMRWITWDQLFSSWAIVRSWKSICHCSISAEGAEESLIMNWAMSIENVNVRCVSTCLETEKNTSALRCTWFKNQVQRSKTAWFTWRRCWNCCAFYGL